MFSTFFKGALTRPTRLAAFASLTLALAACGGGGGSPGTVGNNPGTDPGNPAKVPASVVLASSADTINASGADGTEVTLTAVVKDSGNNAISGATVSFSASSGTVSSTNRITDATGTVTEKLSVKGDATPREITITATAGAVTSSAKKITVVATTASTPKVLLTASNGSLASADTAQVAIRALILDANNVIVAGAPVTFTTSSGALSASQVVSDANGVATVNLGTGTDPTSRSITVTAAAPGAVATTVKVNVVGSLLTLNNATSVKAGESTSVTAVLVDSAGNPLANRPVTFSATRGGLTTASGQASPATTDSAGKLVLTYRGNGDGADTITVSSMGETASTVITTVSTNFSVAAVAADDSVLATANTGACSAVLVRDFNGAAPRAGTVTISTSRGTVYSDANCGFVQNGAVNLAGGIARVYVKAISPGLATLTATSSATGTTVQGTVEFVAPLVASATINMQASPAVIGANAVGSSTEQSVLRAIVLDKAVDGNPVKNARIAFSIISDPSGGRLSQPSEVLTAADGSASVTYIAGATTTATDGVVIEARIVSTLTSATTTSRLTVGRRSLFITAGTGNTVELPSTSTYRVDYTVFVTDSAGNPVNDVALTASVRPRYYYKGYRRLNTVTNRWETVILAQCLNEDLDSNGVLSAAEDLAGNGNGRLDPGTPLNITSSVKTGANGTAEISLTYPKDRVDWVDVDFTIRGQVAGSETSYVSYTDLAGAAVDFSNPSVAPPGVQSPYGISNDCKNPN